MFSMPLEHVPQQQHDLPWGLVVAGETVEWNMWAADELLLTGWRLGSVWHRLVVEEADGPVAGVVYRTICRLERDQIM